MACLGTLAMTTAILFFLVSTAIVVAGDMTFGKKPISRKTLIGFELKEELICGGQACRYEVNPDKFCADLYLTHYDLRCGKCGAIYCNDLESFNSNVKTDAGTDLEKYFKVKTDAGTDLNQLNDNVGSMELDDDDVNMDLNDEYTGLIDNLNNMDMNNEARSGSTVNVDMEVDLLPPPIVENS